MCKVWRGVERQGRCKGWKGGVKLKTKGDKGTQ